jgi:hypothetical protein
VIFAGALRASLASFPPDGHFEAEGVNAVLRVLAVSNPKIKLTSAQLARTYTNEFLTAH